MMPLKEAAPLDMIEGAGTSLIQRAVAIPALGNGDRALD
jgi:hypothetical protein